MKIAHIAIWTIDLERKKRFYATYFGAIPNNKYENKVKQFTSYFLSFDGGASLELMHTPQVAKVLRNGATAGFAHLAISVGSKEDVDRITLQIEADGYNVVGKLRTTGDGYYESVIEDPEGNLIEITA